MSVLKNVDLLNYHAEAKDYAGKELARAYIPSQKLGEIYSPDESLKAGTVFPELYMPYECNLKK